MLKQTEDLRTHLSTILTAQQDGSQTLQSQMLLHSWNRDTLQNGCLEHAFSHTLLDQRKHHNHDQYAVRVKRQQPGTERYHNHDQCVVYVKRQQPGTERHHNHDQCSTFTKS